MLECGNCRDRDWGPALNIMQDQMGSKQRVRQEYGILFHPRICGSFPELEPCPGHRQRLGDHMVI